MATQPYSLTPLPGQAGINNAMALAKSIQDSLSKLSAKGYANTDIKSLPQNTDISKLPTVPTNTAPVQNPTPQYYAPPPAQTTSTDNQLLEKLLASMSPSSRESELSKEAANIEASRRLSYQNIEGQPIATPFITGQEAAVDKGLDIKRANVLGELELEQKKRQGAIDVNKTALDYSFKKAQLAQSGQQTFEVNGQIVERQADGSYKSVFGTATPNYEEISPGATLFDPATGKPIYTAPTAAQVTAGGVSGGGSTIGTGGGAPSGIGALDVGASGESVKALQNWLISKGYSIPAGATGYYGTQTQQAVAAFQKAAGVDTSGGGVGTFGPKTQAAAGQQGLTIAGVGKKGYDFDSPEGIASLPVSDLSKAIISGFGTVKGLTPTKQGEVISELYKVGFDPQNYVFRRLDELKNLWTAIPEDWKGMIEGRIPLAGQANAQVAEFESAKEVLTRIVARLNDVGMLSDQDVASYQRAMPSRSDRNISVVEGKISGLRTSISSVNPASQTPKNTNIGTDPYQQYLRSIGQ